MGNEKSKIDDQKLKLIMDKLDVIEDNPVSYTHLTLPTTPYV